MKKIYSIAFVSFLTLLSSCTSLDETAFSTTSPEKAFKDINAVESMVVGGCYSQARSNSSSHIWATAGDKTFQDNLEFTRFAVQPRNGTMKGIWSGYYKLISVSNSIIENIHHVENGTDEQKNKILGQVHFFRAMSYFYLARYFGDVPLYTYEINTPSQVFELKRNPQSDVYDLIVSDLEEAEKLLPTEWPNEPGRVTKYAAMTMLAKVYLTMAGSPMNQSEYYAKAAAKSKEIIDTKAFSLGDDFESLFIPAKQNGHPAIIYQIEYNSLDGYSAPWYTTTSLLDNSNTSNPGLRVGGQFMATYPDGPRKEANFYKTTCAGAVNFLEKYAGEDVVKFNKDKEYFIKDETEQFCFTKKYCHIGEGESIDPAGRSDQNTVIFRYAEVLLMYAEAITRANGEPDALAKQCLDAVRERAYKGVEAPALTGDFIADVLNEKRLEFAFEAKNWWDIVRLKLPLEYEVYQAGSIVPEVLPATHPDRYLMPIPLDEIELNPNLEQNEGYF